MTKAPLIMLSAYVLVALFAGLSFAIECPLGAGELCTVLDGKELCGKIGPECAGGDYDYGGTIIKLAWKCESTEGCTCYCPFVDKCAGTQCGPDHCDDDILQYNGVCDYYTGQCGYYSQWCKFGCDPATAKCKEFVPEICTNTCSPSEIQAPYPDCNCSSLTCNPGYKLIKDMCVYQESCPTGYALVADTCTPNCDPAQCGDSCGLSVYNSAFKFQQKCVDNVCTDTADPETCLVGCKIDSNNKAQCLEDCDNNVDDDKDGLKDCADPDCKNSLYCQCAPLGTHTGSSGDKVMKVLIGGYYYPATNESYNYNDRDAATLETAQKMMNAIIAADPLSKLNYEFYVTRFAPADWVLTRGDLISKCSEAAKGGDFTMFVNFNKDDNSFSYRYSMGATVYRVGLDFPETWVGNEAVHEFAHGFGGLWDEYVTSTIDVTKGYFSSAVEDSSLNCAMVSTRAECERDFSTRFPGANINCTQECSSSSWWRSSDKNVMRYNFESGTFNDVSKRILEKRISMYLHPEQNRITLNQFESNMKAKGFNTRQLAYVR